MSQLTRTKSIDQILQDPHAREGGSGLKRVLNAKDLTALGVGAIIGAGIFVTTGEAAAGGANHLGAGPAIVLCYLLVAIACSFCALCYAEFASAIPIAGSAYTYAYATLGELAAWIIGWDLILEYAVGNVAVAISWSGYFDSMLRYWGYKIPKWLLTPTMQSNISPEVQAELLAHAPRIAGHLIHFNLPAMVIVLMLTALLIRGVKESTTFNNIVVVIKLLVILLFIGVGFKFIQPHYWHPFAPNGWPGIQSAAALIFFAYIGFDAVSTAAEETENPGRNLPIGMIASLLLCTLLYILVSAVLTGMVPYNQLGTNDPMATAFEILAKDPQRSPSDLRLINFCHIVVAVGAVFSMTAVLLVFQMGQPRIFFSMARDGLLPPYFARVHPVYQTPHVTTIATGLFVSISSGFLDLGLVLELGNIGTLFAFVVVCSSVLLLRYRDSKNHPVGDGPGYRAGSILSLLLGLVLLALAFEFRAHHSIAIACASCVPLCFLCGRAFSGLSACAPRPFTTPLLPLFPILGIFTCLFLMCGFPLVTWARFFLWLVLGLVVYRFYGLRHSGLRNLNDGEHP